MVELEQQEASLASRHIIERPRLTRLLDETTARVIMLVAPAGYGKTTLARQWLANRPHVWFEADSASADVAGLIRKLGQALAPFGCSHDDEELLRSVHDESALETLAKLQTQRVDPWPGDAWLAIDDFEAVAVSAASSSYIEILFRTSTINLLLTSRLLPSWATPRRRLYGDYLIVERDQLAMTDAEAREVLSGRDPQAVPALIAAAEGWPAVLGLASLTKAPEPEGVLPQTLYDYFADELLQRASPDLQRSLPQLARLPTLTPELVASGFGVDGAAARLEEARDLGFLTGSDLEFSFQPLLRAFLNRKRVSAPEDGETAERLTAFLLEREAWDDAFQVLRAAPQAERLVTLIERAHEPLLNAGRTATLAEWLDFATSIGAYRPVLDLIRSEIAIREGATRYAEQLSLRVAEHTQDRPIATRALSIAGRAAHLDNRSRDSLAHFRAAGDLADDDRERHHAAWGALLAAQDLESDAELRHVLETFLKYGTDSPDDAIRAANAQLAMGLTRTGLAGVIEPALATLRTFRDSAEPVALTSLLNSLGRSLSLTARYEEARELADEELDVATVANLQFVIPFGHVSRAVALVGLARYREAADSLSLATRHAEELGDEHNVFDALTVRAKAAMAQRQVEQAAELTATRVDTSAVSSGMRAEYEMTRGLALACTGAIAEAKAVLRGAEEGACIPETIALACCIRAVLSLRQGSTNDEAAHELEEAFDLLMFDPLVVASRAYPALVAGIRATGRHLPQRLIDAMAAQSNPSQQEQLLASLTPREREVLELLTRGHTNREIASELVIAEVTAKVHVRRVIRKLGVRSRTEAAIAAIRPGEPRPS